MPEKIFKDFEVEVLKMLVENELGANALHEIILDAEFVSYEFTGSGYYLTIRHASLPKNRIICSAPIIIGEAENVMCGFVVFLENRELTIECHSWGEIDVPKDFRDKDVELRKVDKQTVEND